MNAWDLLPNAKHIDRLLVSAERLEPLWHFEHKYVTGEELDDISDNVIKNLSKERHEIEKKAERHIRGMCFNEKAYHSLNDAILALIAFDDCNYMLDVGVEELALMAKLGDERSSLILAACMALHKEKQVI